MYGKVFESIYDGTLAGHWQAIVTMQQLIVLATADGVVDMTPEAISRRTTIPLKIIAAGLEHLAKPDPYSRTPGEDGRRIVCIDEHRPWGWQIVNYQKYKYLKNADEVRAQTRDRVRRHRRSKAGLPADGELNCAYCGDTAVGPDHIVPKSKGGSNHEDNIVPSCFRCNQHKGQQDFLAFVSNHQYTWLNRELILSNPKLKRLVTPRNDSKRHTDTDTDTDTKSKDIVGLTPDTRALRKQALEILSFLNEKTGRYYQPVPANVDMIVARLKDGATVEDLRAVVAKKAREWKGDEKMELYIRPATLFNRTKFAQYQGELGAK